MLHAANGEQAHIEGKTKAQVDHSTAGAILLHDAFVARVPPLARILAFAIAGHHAGLADFDGAGSLRGRLSKRHCLDVAREQAPSDACLVPEKLPPPGVSLEADLSLSLWTRMLFSCLVDADFLDTEAFVDPDRHALRPKRRSDWPALLAAFSTHMTGLAESAKSSAVNQLRAEVLADCIQAAESAKSRRTLTVPTGGGKTLSSLAYALHHARTHGKDRIIYVIPYTSIIEQTADVFRRVFSDLDGVVLEHHSNIDAQRDGQETRSSRLAAENWDAPIVVTTAVQFFESFFASRTSRCRKLHNVANSVVVLDEAQMLPPDFLEPILRLLDELAKNYRVSLLLTTATQPALAPRDGFNGLPGLVEIARSPKALHASFRRVRPEIPDDLNQARSWPDLAGDLQCHAQVLCIVDRRADAAELFGLIAGPDSFHLSGVMCGEHRSDVIAEIKRRLLAKEPVRVISTQLIEAGVDVDFPVVFRALAGLDSIWQAAGRCNREGRLEAGRLVVFVPPKPPPCGHLRQAAGITQSILAGKPADPCGPGQFTNFFRQLYWIKGEDGLDRKGIVKLLNRANAEFAFRSAAEAFRLIDSAYESVVVRYGRGTDLIDDLLSGARPPEIRRQLQRFVVNLPPKAHDELLSAGAIIALPDLPGVYLQTGNCYDRTLGLHVPSMLDPLIV